MTTTPIGKVLSYLAKHSPPVQPTRESDGLNLDIRKWRVKGSKLDEWRLKGQLGGVCDECNTTVTRLTVDHIVPLYFLNDIDNAFQIAVNDEENFQFMCEVCNRKKSGRIDIRNPKTAPLLAKYIAPYL